MTRKNTILIVDDASLNRIALKKILSDKYEVLEAENGQIALEVLEENKEHISAIVLDLIMPVFSGFEFMKVYHESETYRNTPVIITTSDRNPKTERECLELGAWDFVSKPYDPSIICFRIKNVIDRSEMQMSRELKYRAEYDILTGIYNKTKFFLATRDMLNAYPKEKFVFLRMDIEKFQLINAFYGMKEGDRLLKYIAEFIMEDANKRETVTYGRMEADIFGICMTYKNKKEITAYIEEVRERLNSYPIEFDLVPTFGIYLIDDREIPLNDMYDRANLAAKQCKGNYVKSYAYYTEDMSAEIYKEQKIVNSMKNALKNEQFVLYLQPKYDIKTNTIDGAEVLVRWKDPEKGMISPGDFIPVFERNGFIMRLDFYVWEKTCQLLHKWIEEGRNPYPISVNISRVSLYNPKIVDVICGLVKKYDIPPRLLQLELTESAYTNNAKAIKEMMARFRKKGFSILMDDFGSGYSSLNVLKDIVVDILKIDMEFLSDADKAGRSENILASVVRMAKWLDMPVVAEGVERKEQVAFLRSIGCEYVQGYYFAKPMPVEEYEKLAFADEKSFVGKKDSEKINTDSIWTSTSQMEILFSNMLQAVAVYEYDDGFIDIIRVNDAYYDMFGYTDINHLQKNIMETVDQKHQEVLMKAFAKVIENGDVTQCEVKRRLENGKYIWVDMKLKYISKVGKRHVIFGSLSDITTQKEMDRELQKYRLALSEAQNAETTILIVDDMEINRVSLRSIFEEKYQILEAENGKEALEVLAEHGNKVDIILLDIVMPVMDGPAFLNYQKSDPDIAGIPVIIITADNTTKQQVETMQMGAKDYIVKPFIPEIAIQRVRNVLESTRRFGQVLRGYDEAAGK